MSAQLAEPDMVGYIAYGGRFSVDETTSTVHHDVTMSMMPELLAHPQFRRARVDGDHLTLSATMTRRRGCDDAQHAGLAARGSSLGPAWPGGSLA